MLLLFLMGSDYVDLYTGPALPANSANFAVYIKSFIDGKEVCFRDGFGVNQNIEIATSIANTSEVNCLIGYHLNLGQNIKQATDAVNDLLSPDNCYTVLGMETDDLSQLRRTLTVFCGKKE